MTLKDLVGDLGTAIQVAIDDANAKGHEPDPAMEKLIGEINSVILELLPEANCPHASQSKASE